MADSSEPLVVELLVKRGPTTLIHIVGLALAPVVWVAPPGYEFVQLGDGRLLSRFRYEPNFRAELPSETDEA